VPNLTCADSNEEEGRAKLPGLSIVSKRCACGYNETATYSSWSFNGKKNHRPEGT
jgi:hypothetical protein